MRKLIPWLVTLMTCFLVTGALATVKYQQITAAIAYGASFPETYEVVNAQQPGVVSYTPARRLGGTVRRPQFSEITTEIGGRIVALPVPAGSVAQKGDVLVELFSADLTARQDALRAEQRLVTMQLKRSRALKEQALISQSDIDIQESQLNALDAQISAIDAQLTRLTIRAPFAGQMGIYTQVVGDMLDAGEVIAAFTGLGNERWIDFNVPQGLAAIAVGDTINLFDLDGEALGMATITVVSDSINANTRTFAVRASAQGLELKHGELVQVEVANGATVIAFELPPSGVRWDTKGPYIFQLNESEAGAQRPYRAQSQRITLIDKTASRALFVANINEQSLFATTGAFKLNDGVLAQLVNGTNGS